MNRRVAYTRALPADVLTVIEEPESVAPERGQVLVRTTAFSVHPGDLQAIEAYPGKAVHPVPAGLEATGVMEAIGRGAPWLRVSRSVAAQRSSPSRGRGPSGSWRMPRWSSPYRTSCRTTSPRRCLRSRSPR
ncbi:alcohol dehydrogenase catalytic domain-containing protein [Streptomyces atratus]|uniref:alcohol dehydrogenase catalytic domain-containing protein n=1 Tax=Streptomyces atratus TaxID=1893 RepID=UPI003F540766